MLEESMLCIICMEMKPVRTGSGEHVVPYAMGGSFTIDRVCLRCDNRLGNAVDAGLINLSTVEERRAELGLRGHNGKVPDPAARRLKEPLVNVNDPKHKLFLRETDVPGELVPKTASIVEFDVLHLPDGILIQPARVYIDPLDVGNAAMYAMSALRKKGVTDQATVERIGREFAEGLESVAVEQEFERKINVVVGGHQVGVLKIAYELAWYWLGDEWLSDPIAVTMREMLTGREKTIHIPAKIYDEPNVAIMAVEGDMRVLHVAYVYEYNGNLMLFVRLFDLMTAG